VWLLREVTREERICEVEAEQPRQRIDVHVCSPICPLALLLVSRRMPRAGELEARKRVGGPSKVVHNFQFLFFTSLFFCFTFMGSRRSS
jgi:hypothetical protein